MYYLVDGDYLDGDDYIPDESLFDYFISPFYL